MTNPENLLACEPTNHTLTHRHGKLCCTVCGGENGDMPTMCPGSYMDEEIAEQVAMGGLDCLPDQGWKWLKARHEFNQKRAAARADYERAIDFEAQLSAL